MSAPPPPPSMKAPPPPSLSKGAPPPPPGKGKEVIKKKWAPVKAEQTLSKWSLDKDWNFTHGLPSIDVDSEIEWKDAKGVCEADEGGSGGVFFIEFTNKALVIKASLNIASDTFASRLATRIGILIPRTRLVYYLKSSEWDPMVSLLWQLEQTNSVAGRGSKFAKCLNRPFLLLTEYVAGYHLANLPKDKASTIINHSVLFEIGKLISLDLLLNQWDRFPCGNVWANEGNPKNIIISPKGDNKNEYVVNAIDNNVTSIDPSLHASNFISHRNKVGLALSEILKSGDAPCSVVEPTRQFILQNTGYDIGNEGQISIQKGIINGAKLIAELPDNELKDIRESIDKQVSETLFLLGVDGEHIGLSNININFLESIRKVFVDVLANNFKVL